jgi:uncharacterized protein (TIGR02466 family)
MAKSTEPSAIDIQKLIQAINSGQFANAEKLARDLIAQHPNTFILHHVLSLALDGQQKFNEAAIAYKNALKIQPKMPDLWFNLGIVFSKLNQPAEAADAYLQAIKVNPNFFEAHGNLGIILQQQGKLDDAIKSYRKGLTLNPADARGYFNLGTALRDKGQLADAVNAYQQTLKLFPNYTDAHNNLGETLRDMGDMDAAVKSYQAALTLNANHANANYNMAEFLYLAKQFAAAIPYFEHSKCDDYQARILYCLYKGENFDAFRANIHAASSGADGIMVKNDSPFIATLSTHYSINFGVPDAYNFCKNPLDFVYKNAIKEIAPNSSLLKDLLNDIEHAQIAERKQARLTNGQQSAGNLFKRPEASFKALAELIKKEFLAYKNHFHDADCELIKAFPSELEFTSSWYVKIQQGGHLNAHIHEIGWISGAVYLAMPAAPENSNEGAFEYGTHGDDYPIIAPRSLDDFPKAHVMPNVGDIVLFPSSLFHRTVPFSANTERICIAFDLKPALQTSAKTSY